MTKDELAVLEQKNNAAIIAPAGHGKTEMVADMVAAFQGKQLVLTHTNAGVDAIKKRLARRKVPSDKYTVQTIASFCMRWGLSYHHTANIDITISPFTKYDKSKYYASLYSGAITLFSSPWMGKVLKATFSGIIVDEYQDCVLMQHALVQKLNEFLPVRILGDPLQGIFGFKDPIIDWNNIGFETINIETYPWRWEKSNPALGQYLTELRSKLIPSLQKKKCRVHLQTIDGIVQIIHPDSFNGYRLLPDLQKYKSVLYLTKWEQDQLAFCKQMPGIFQHDEKQDCELLFQYADSFDHRSKAALLLTIIKFVSECATQVTSECASYIRHLEKESVDFSRIKKHLGLAQALETCITYENYDSLLAVLKWFEENPMFKFYRKELYMEMQRAISLAKRKDITIYEAAAQIRSEIALQKRYTEFKFLSSRTLLSKGLEFDCVIIDTRKALTAKDFYVAMTRARQMIYVISDKTTLDFAP